MARVDDKGYYRDSRGKLIHRKIAYKMYLEGDYDLGFGDYVVHHKNGNKKDNRRSNLKILTPEEHNAIHNIGFASETDKYLGKVFFFVWLFTAILGGIISMFQEKGRPFLHYLVELNIIWIIVFVVGAAIYGTYYGLPKKVLIPVVTLPIWLVFVIDSETAQLIVGSYCIYVVIAEVFHQKNRIKREQELLDNN